MSALTQGNTAGDWLKDEFGAPNHCREAATLASGQDLASGAVVALGAGSTYSAFIHDDGTYGTAAGVLVDAVDASGGAADCVVLVRGPATIKKSALAWHADNDAAEIVIGLASLKALGIIAREGV